MNFKYTFILMLIGTKLLIAQVPIPSNVTGLNGWMPYQVGCVVKNGSYEDIRQNTNLISSLGAKFLRYGGSTQDKQNITASTPYINTFCQNAIADGFEPIIQIPFISELISVNCNNGMGTYNGTTQNASNQTLTQDINAVLTNFTYQQQVQNLVQSLNNVYGVTYFSIGNEPDLWNTKNLIPVPITVGHILQYFNVIAGWIKNVLPNAIIVGPDLSSYNQSTYNQLLANTTFANLVNIVSFHTYPFDGTSNNSQPPFQPQRPLIITQPSTDFDQWLSQLNSYIGSNAIKIGVLEFNVTFNNPSALNCSSPDMCNDIGGTADASFIAGQWMAECIAKGINRQVAMMAAFSFHESSGDRSVTDHGIIDGKYDINNLSLLQKRSTYHHLNMMAADFSSGCLNFQQSLRPQAII